MNKILIKLVVIMMFVSLIWNLKEKVIDPYLFYTSVEEKRMYVAVYDKKQREIIDSGIMIVSIKDDVTITYQDTVCVIPIQDDLVGFPSVGPYPCFNDENIEWKVYFGKGLEEIVIQNAKVSTISESGWGWYEHSQIFHIATRKNVNNKYNAERILNKIMSYFRVY